ncbi:MAG: isocitrate lyase/phosphoenolpyruvate mutase family protein [Hyphomicrobiales bacterium]|nr:isocitrate lyase/phosphoenolpyruvate mutase family protein [Hyphomicrobiales bacterium]
MTSHADKAAAFRRLHEADGIFVMPNAWDAGSAKFLAAAGFQAIATTSGGVNWSRGRRDWVLEAPRDEMLDAYGDIATAVDVPVSGDLENGYGNEPEAVAATITGSIARGMVGGGIEDWTANPADPLYEIGLAVERIRAAREAGDASEIRYTLTGRCEVFCTDLPQAYAQAVDRCNRYVEAGADCVFVPGLTGAENIKNFVRDVDAPLNMVAGLADPRLTVAELADLGVKRISTGGSLARACFGLLKQAAEDLASTGRFDYVEQAISDPGIDTFFRTGAHAE